MCRLFGHISSSPTTVSGALGEDAGTFTALSGRHKDGWGLVGLDGSGAQRTGDTLAARESPRYASASTSFASTGLLMHFRLASPGTPVIDANLHPFETVLPGLGPVAFAHNGHMFDVPALRRLVAGYSDAPLRGTTDSESYAQLVFALMRDLSPAEALSTAAGLIQEVTDVVALNALLLTPSELHALQWLDPAPRSDGFRNPLDPALFVMRSRTSEPGVTVASNEWEPSGEGWENLPDREVLSFARAA